MTYYYWDSDTDNVFLEEDENGNVVAEYTHEPGLYGELIAQERDGQVHYYNFDAQGSTCELTDENGDVTDTFAYTAFGEEVTRTGTTENPFGYKGALGYYTNGDTDDIYVRERPYEPSVGRWVSADPLGFVDGANWYVFVGNSPVNRNDPSGLQVAPPRQIPHTHLLVEETEVPCHRDCNPEQPPCTFAFSLFGRGAPGGGLMLGARITLEMRPGMIPSLLFPPPIGPNEPLICRLRRCQSDIERALSRRDHFTITLPSGVVCRYDEGVFPDGNSGPDDSRLPPRCRNVVVAQPIVGGPANQGVVYVVAQPVKSISVSFCMRVFCGCELGGREEGPPQPILRTANSDTLCLIGTIP